jgi:hypothetical protein
MEYIHKCHLPVVATAMLANEMTLDLKHQSTLRVKIAIAHRYNPRNDVMSRIRVCIFVILIFRKEEETFQASYYQASVTSLRVHSQDVTSN